MTSANLRRSLMSIAAGVLCAAQTPAQPGEILCQPVECGTFRPLDEAHKGRLQDPFFRLVLDPRPDARKLAEIEALIQGANGKRRFFVVHEEIQDPIRRGHRRAVVDFIGENAGFSLGANIMLSFAFTPDQVPEIPDLEVLAWDNVNGVYNYYKLDDERPPAPPGSAPLPDKVWKLAATSRNADQMRPQDRIGTCLACHMSGVPVMKELHFPWNNWHSSQSRIGYLVPSTPPANRWPVADDAHFKDLALAEPLEGAVTNSIQAFNNRRFEQLVGKDAQGNLTVADARRVLRPLFETSEINFASARQRSNLHPLAPTPQTGPSQTIEIPSSFFLAADILASVGIDEVDFQSVARVDAAAYKVLIESSGVEIEGATGPARGDTHFAWFTPEQGFVAIHWIDTLVQNKLLSPAFVAAAAAADLENPIFSQQRASLIRFIPEAFTATPDEPHPDALTREVMTRLEAAQPQPGSVEADFLATLQAPDPVAVVRSRVTAYRNRIEQSLAEDADPAIRNAELKRLFDLLIDRRRTLVNLPEFRNLKESKALLPLPPQN